MIKNKKGDMVWNRLVGIILITIAFIILVILITRFFPVFVGELGPQVCKTSVDLKASYIEKSLEEKAGSALLYGVPQLKCETQYECITMGGECPKGYFETTAKDEEQIKKRLADSMYRCWDQLGRGQKNFFERDLTKEQYCVFCSVITFDSKIQEEYPEIGGLANYFATEKRFGTNLTYWQHFITPKGVPKETAQTKYDPEIQTDKDYLIVYSLIERDHLKRSLTAGTVGGIASWGIVPATTKAGAGLGTLAGPGGTLVGGTIGFVSGVAIAVTGGIFVGDAVQDAAESANPGDYFVKFDLAPFEIEDIQKVGCTQIESIP